MGAVADRVGLLVGYFVASGVGVVLAVFIARIRALWAAEPSATAAAATLGAADLVPVLIGGAYWSSYLLPLLVSTIVFALPLGILLTHQVVTRRDWAAAAGVVAALATFIVVGDPAAGADDAADWKWAVSGVVVIVLAAGVNPNKVYLMGYSHGGYGAFFIGPLIADRFAAVHASASEVRTSVRPTRTFFI